MRAAAIHFAARGWILAAALLALLAARAISSAPLRPAWLFLVLAGIALRLWAGAHLGPHGNAARAQAPALATRGPYRFSRNPLYLSNLLIAAGTLFYANALAPLVSAVLVAAIFLHHALLVRHEEKILAATHGKAYAAYRRATPRWIGRPGGTSGNASERGEGGGSLRAALFRQGRNVVHALAGAGLVWVAARWF